MRGMLTFFSTLAFAVMTAAAIVAIMPWLSGRTAAAATAAEGGLHLESLLLGVVLGLVIGSVARFEWADIPRRIVTWVLIRERQFFYYALIGGCIGVLLFY
ncbi:MAG: hypothetical protein ABL893_06835 [Hyphomicrobium sp.]|nr:hypothetical protein [Hyphomicrobium sp.]